MPETAIDVLERVSLLLENLDLTTEESRQDAINVIGGTLNNLNLGSYFKNPATGQGYDEIGILDPGSFPALTQESADLMARLPIPDRYVSAFPRWATMKGWKIEIGTGENIDSETLDKVLKFKIEQFKREGTTIASYFKEAQINANVGNGKEGGAALLLDVDDGQMPDKPINYNNVRGIRGVYLLDITQIKPEIQSFTYFIEPIAYELSLPNIDPRLRDDQREFLEKLKKLLRIDASRVIPFYGAKYTSRIRRNYYQGWGGSLLPLIYEDYTNYITSSQALNRFIKTASTVIVKIQNFFETISGLNFNDASNPLALEKQQESLMAIKKTLQGIMQGLTLWGGAAIDSNMMDISYANRSSNGLENLHNEMRVNLTGTMKMPHSIMWGEVPNGWGATNDHEGKPWGREVLNFQGEWANGLQKWYMIVFAFKDGPTRGRIPESWEIKFIPVQDLGEETESGIRTTNYSNCIQLFNTIDNTGKRAMSIGEVRSNIGQVDLRTTIILDDEIYQADLEAEQQAQAQFAGGGYEPELAPPEGEEPVETEAVVEEEPVVEEEIPTEEIQQDSAKPVKKRINYRGFTIALETLSGEKRFNKKLKGFNYGHVTGTRGLGADGDAIDCYVSDAVIESPQKTHPLFKVTQLDPKGNFDEYKYMLGFKNQNEARKAYLSVMPAHFLGKIELAMLSEFQRRADAKRTRAATYIHKSALSTLPKNQRDLVDRANAIATAEQKRGTNLYKISNDKDSVSLLSYPDFEEDPHPSLKKSVKVNLKTRETKEMAYPNNPPILHRKETFIKEDDPNYQKFKNQTEKEDKRGLLNSHKIGNKKQWEEISKSDSPYSDKVNATDTGRGGATGITPPICIQVVKRIAPKGASILDYGAGRNAVGTNLLRKAGFKSVTAWDIGENQTEEIDPDALSRKYQVVIASNVLNVQPDEGKIKTVIRDLKTTIKPGGYGIANYPSSPRKSGLNGENILSLLKSSFGKVEIVQGGLSAPVFRFWKSTVDDREDSSDMPVDNLDPLIEKYQENAPSISQDLLNQTDAWLKKQENYGQALNNLEDLYNNLDISQLENDIAQGSIIGDYLGRIEVSEEDIENV